MREKSTTSLGKRSRIGVAIAPKARAGPMLVDSGPSVVDVVRLRRRSNSGQGWSIPDLCGHFQVRFGQIGSKSGQIWPRPSRTGCMGSRALQGATSVEGGSLEHLTAQSDANPSM